MEEAQYFGYKIWENPELDICNQNIVLPPATIDLSLFILICFGTNETDVYMSRGVHEGHK